MSSPTDSELVQRCIRADPSGWEALTERYADLVYSVAWRSGLRGDDAADVVQEVFLSLLQHLERVRDADRLGGWIAMTARREAWRQVKRARAGAARERKRARPDRDEDMLPDEALERLETEHAVRRAFARISTRCRDLLDALFFQATPRSYAEIAQDLGVPIGSLGPTRRRCLDALERALTEVGIGPPDDVSGSGTSPSGKMKRKPR